MRNPDSKTDSSSYDDKGNSVPPGTTPFQVAQLAIMLSSVKPAHQRDPKRLIPEVCALLVQSDEFMKGNDLFNELTGGWFCMEDAQWDQKKRTYSKLYGDSATEKIHYFQIKREDALKKIFSGKGETLQSRDRKLGELLKFRESEFPKVKNTPRRYQPFVSKDPEFEELTKRASWPLTVCRDLFRYRKIQKFTNRSRRKA